MTSKDSGESEGWFQEGTPREDWDVDTDYGVEVDPADWDDYAEEQAVPVPTPAAAREYRSPKQSAEEQPLAETSHDDATSPAASSEPGPESQQESHGQEPPVPEPTQENVPPEHQPTAERGPEDFAAEEAGARPSDAPAESDQAAPGDHVDPAGGAWGVGTDESSVDEALAADDDVEATQIRPRPSVVEPDAEPAATAAAPAAMESREGLEDERAVGEATADERDGAPIFRGPDDAATGGAPPEDEGPWRHEEPATSDDTAVHAPFQEPQADDHTQANDHARGDADRAAAETADVDQAEDGDDDRHGGVAAAAGGAAAGAGFASLYRDDSDAEADDEHTEMIARDPEERAAERTQALDTGADEPPHDRTQVIDQSRLQEEQAAEEARLARLQEQRDARDARLGVVPGSEENNIRVVEKPVKRQSDRFFGAFSLLVLRLVTAFVVGVLGYQVLQDVDAATEFLSNAAVPEARLVAWILGFAFVTMAVMLVLGLGVRIVGVVLFIVAIASLVVLRWGQFSIFQDGLEGFLGDRTLLTAAVALVFVGFGSGRVGIDGAIRGSRDKSKLAQSH